MLDVNAGVTAVNPNETEPPLLVETIEIVQSLVDLPISIDSSVPAAMKAGLEVAMGRPLVNSVTGEEDRLEAILPLIKKYDVPVIAISNDETGISEDPDVRFAVAKKIVERAPITASRRTTSSSTRWSCRSARWATPAARSSRWCGGCARS